MYSPKTHSALLPPQVNATSKVAQTPVKGLRQGASRQGWGGLLVALIMVFSVSATYRISVAGLLIHPYLLAAPVAALLLGYNLLDVPNRTLRLLLAFLLLVSLSLMLNERRPLPELFKIGAGLFTFLFFAQAVNRQADYHLISWGFIAVSAFIAFRVISMARSPETVLLEGVSGLEGFGNKNAMSLYLLPGTFMAGFKWLEALRQRKWLWFGLLSGLLMLMVVGAIFSGNRSGWLSLAFVFACMILKSGISARTLLLIMVVSSITYVAVTQVANRVFEHKLEVTQEGYTSDTKRQRLIYHSTMIALENPFLGAGKEKLFTELATRLRVRGLPQVDTHNLIMYLTGGMGIIVLMLFLAFMRVLTLPPAWSKSLPAVKNARYLILCFVLLFLLRSFFTREILYSPTFMGGLGLCYALLLQSVRHAWQQKNATHA